MPHTPLAKLLRHAALTAAQSEGRNAPENHFAVSRRKFIKTVSTATAGLALPRSLFGTGRVRTSARVVVVGAGLAGLTCAYRLKRSGIIATVYEANTRLGGRCWTRRDRREGRGSLGKEGRGPDGQEDGKIAQRHPGESRGPIIVMPDPIRHPV